MLDSGKFLRQLGKKTRGEAYQGLPGQRETSIAEEAFAGEAAYMSYVAVAGFSGPAKICRFSFSCNRWR